MVLYLRGADCGAETTATEPGAGVLPQSEPTGEDDAVYPLPVAVAFVFVSKI